MSQTGIITAALLIAFLVFVTMKGELSKYGAVFYGVDKNAKVAPSSSSSGSGSSGSGSEVSEVVGIAAKVAPLVAAF